MCMYMERCGRSSKLHARLKQDVMRELMGMRRSYVAVLTANKEMDLCYHDVGKDEWLRGHNHIL